ncbi:IPT/TIG domain-containing protein [Micromonospora pallida]|uniref:IPT/TIG domain-containing protein n=1 Tax=Micromonospora pallida TaxID=145854 RepID=A0A1C6RH22_9ACTN|nr:IPT/TIG domain-containing protein [Micromonospora pallida]SCL16336.1 IPT/TIG domain-containing protein [Micromonospora pallida]
MATTPTTRVTALARRMRVDIDTATYPASQYQQLIGIEELKLIEELRTESDETYEDDGAAREAVTGYNWRIEAKIKHSTNAAGTSIDSVHAFLRNRFNAAKASNVASAEFGVRWYDRNGLAGDSFEGRAYVKAWPHDGGGTGALDTVSVVIQGQGPLTPITNPAASAVPAVTGLNPAGGPTAGGNLVNIYGSKFTGVTGATGVKFGANNATNYTLVSDTHIVATARPVLPAPSR